MRFVVLFYGITRGLEYTMNSINSNVLTPLQEAGEVDIYGSLYKLKSISNLRSREQHKLDYENYSLLNFDSVSLLEPMSRDAEIFRKLANFGDFWQDDYQSLLNITMQLQAIKHCWNSLPDKKYDLFLFLRPDLEYHDSFTNIIDILKQRNETTLTPKWQRWGGYNDRFVCTNDLRVASIIANRFDNMVQFCQQQSGPFHAETFLKWCLDGQNVGVQFVNNRASRIRADGTRKNESFSMLSNVKVVKDLKFHLGQIKDKIFAL